MTDQPGSPQGPQWVPPGQQPPQGGPPAKPPKKRKKWPFIVGGVLLLFIIISVASNSGGSKTNTAAATSTAAAPTTTSAAPAPTTQQAAAPTSAEPTTYALGVPWQPGQPVPNCTAAAAFYVAGKSNGDSRGGTDIQVFAHAVQTVAYVIDHADGTAPFFGREATITEGMTGHEFNVPDPIGSIKDVLIIASGNANEQRGECMAMHE